MADVTIPAGNDATEDRQVPDRLAVLIFRVSGDTDDEVADEVVKYLEAPSDWSFELAAVVTSEQEFKRLSFGMWNA